MTIGGWIIFGVLGVILVIIGITIAIACDNLIGRILAPIIALILCIAV